MGVNSRGGRSGAGKLTSFFSRETLTAVMASSSGDSVTRRSVALQFFTQEEGPGIDGMSTSERVSVAAGAAGGLGGWGLLGVCGGVAPAFA